jgi:DNA mismatch repair protein MutS2
LDARTLKSLEFYKVIERVKPWASTIMGTEKIEHLTPSSDAMEAKHLLNATQEGMTVIRLKDTVPLGGIKDIRSACARASLGGILNPGELLDIASTLAAGGRLKGFIHSVIEKEPLPILEELVDGIIRIKDVEEEITRAIDDKGYVMDVASSALSQIRSQIRTGEKRVREKLEHMIRNPGIQKMLQDPIITIRNDRFVIPVRPEYRNSFGGLVHDQSASGATLFIEPEQVVQINNELRELKLKEERARE